MEAFTDLEAWKNGVLLLKEVYHLTDLLPSDEKFGLSSQLRRASVSVLANIAEGFSRSGSADKAHKYTISRGECSEVKALLIIATEVDRLSVDDITDAVNLADRQGRLLSGLINSFQKRKSSTIAQP